MLICYFCVQISSAMKHTFLFVFLVLSAIGQGFSQSAVRLNESQTRLTAQTFIDTKPQFQNAELQLVSASNIFVYNVGEHGFVIVSGSTVLPPVLGYSDQGNFPDLTDAPENVTDD